MRLKPLVQVMLDIATAGLALFGVLCVTALLMLVVRFMWWITLGI